MDNEKIFYYPGWTKKSMTFTIDDGNTILDRKFIDIVRPAGITGAFNVTTKNLKRLTPEQCRELYAGFEITNHSKTHPFLLKEKDKERITEEPFVETEADVNKVYKTDREGYYYFKASNGWRIAAELEAYKEDVRLGHVEAVEIFGEGSIGAYAWPYTIQESEELDAYIKSFGYYGVRASGPIRDKEGFNIPKNRFPWYGTSHYNEILELGQRYESLADDGNLKFFCFGFHSHDFENNKAWHNLEEFARIYGNRPSDFWYSTPRSIFAYQDAVRATVVSESQIVNNSDLTLYAVVNGEKVTVAPHATVNI